MKNILAMGSLGLVIFAGLGWYLDWYKVQRSMNADGKQSITIDVNTRQIQSDLHKGRDKMGGFFTNAPTSNYPQVPPPVSPQPYPGFAPAPSAPGYGAYPNTGVPAYPNTGAPQYPAPSQPFQPGQNGWIPAQPTSNPQGGSFVFPGQPQAVPTFPPAQPYPR